MNEIAECKLFSCSMLKNSNCSCMESEYYGSRCTEAYRKRCPKYQDNNCANCKKQDSCEYRLSALVKRQGEVKAAYDIAKEVRTKEKPKVTDFVPFTDSTKKAFAYTRGSFNINNSTYGYGVVLCYGEEIKEDSNHGNKENVIGLRNIAGELLGASQAVNMAKAVGINELTLYYVYDGVEKYVTGEWKAKDPCMASYRAFMEKCGVKILFKKIKNTDPVENSKRAEYLAQKETGIIR